MQGVLSREVCGGIEELPRKNAKDTKKNNAFSGLLGRSGYQGAKRVFFVSFAFFRGYIRAPMNSKNLRSHSMDDIMKLCDIVRQTGYDLHRYLGGGQLEKVYENGLAHRLKKLGIEVQQQLPLNVFD